MKRLGRLNVHLVAVAGASQATYAKRGYREAMRVQIEHGIFDFCGAPVLTSDLIESQDVDAVAVAEAADAVVRHLPEAASRVGG